MADPIRGEWLSAAALAIESEPAGSPPARLAMAVLTVVVPLVRAERAQGTVTGWGVRWTYSGETTTETWSHEDNARGCLEETLWSGAADAGTPVTLLRREIGPWKEAGDGEG